MPIKIRSYNENQIILETVNEFYKKQVETKFITLIKNAISEVTNIDYNIILVSPENAPATKPVIKTEDKILNANLNPKYVFESFVVGNSNRMAHAASLAVAEAPASAYNPLFLYGNVGLGKTHLMHSIAHYILDKKPDTKVLYVTSETFTNELINSISTNKNEEFRNNL